MRNFGPGANNQPTAHFLPWLRWIERISIESKLLEEKIAKPSMPCALIGVFLPPVVAKHQDILILAVNKNTLSR